MFNIRNNGNAKDMADLIRMLENASFEDRERVRLAIDAVALVETDNPKSTGRGKVIIVTTEDDD